MEDKARIWFFTDIHGSNLCFRKFLNAVKNENKPNVLIIGADITGKQIIPFIESDNKVFTVPIGSKELKVRFSELDDLKKKLSDIGYYPYECSIHEYKKFSFNDETRRKVFNRLIKERLEEWIKLADERLPSSDMCKVIVNAGNDDPYFIDAILDRSTKLIRGEGKIIEVATGIKILSTGYSIPTPWNCPRDITEDNLKAKIAAMTDSVNENDKLIFNFHCPPKNTSLDLANKIDIKTFKLQAGLGSNPTVNAGSQSVRGAIEFWQPIASLHGHIHEVHAKQKIGSTLSYNPGTDYLNGRLQGVFLKINNKGIIEYETLTQERYSTKTETDRENSLTDTIISMLSSVGTIITTHTTSEKQDQIESKIDNLDEKIEILLNKKD